VYYDLILGCSLPRRKNFEEKRTFLKRKNFFEEKKKFLEEKIFWKKKKLLRKFISI
jgi:hypothetical protein